MASSEEFKSPFSASFEFPDTVPDQWPVPLEELQAHERFQEVCNRLLELNISFGQNSHFKVPVPEWVSMLSRSVGHPGNGDLRLTFNMGGIDDSGMPLLMTRDYILNLHDGSTVEWEGWLDSEVRSYDDVQFTMNSTSGPRIQDEDGVITVCSQIPYERKIFRREEPFASGLAASNSLLSDLRYFSPIHRDEVGQIIEVPIK